MRIPGYSKKYTLTVNGKKTDAEVKNGYLYLAVEDKDVVKLILDDTPHYLYASAKVPALTGKTAIQRGPLVYCFEGVDNDGNVLELSLKRGGKLVVSAYNEALLKGTVTIEAEAVRRKITEDLYTCEVPEEKPCTATAVPYYTWGNRGENQMRVWMSEKT